MWFINDIPHEHVIKHSFNQDVCNLKVTASKRLIGRKNHFLTQAQFKTRLINRQEVQRSYLMDSESSVMENGFVCHAYFLGEFKNNQNQQKKDLTNGSMVLNIVKVMKLRQNTSHTC